MKPEFPFDWIRLPLEQATKEIAECIRHTLQAERIAIAAVDQIAEHGVEKAIKHAIDNLARNIAQRLYAASGKHDQ